MIPVVPPITFNILKNTTEDKKLPSVVNINYFLVISIYHATQESMKTEITRNERV